MQQLGDRERKVLRILHNFSAGRKRIPSIHEIKIKTGLSEEQIILTLQSLNDKMFIAWDPFRHTELQIIRAWESPPPAPPKKA